MDAIAARMLADAPPRFAPRGVACRWCGDGDSGWHFSDLARHQI